MWFNRIIKLINSQYLSVREHVMDRREVRVPETLDPKDTKHVAKVEHATWLYMCTHIHTCIVELTMP